MEQDVSVRDECCLGMRVGDQDEADEVWTWEMWW